MVDMLNIIIMEMLLFKATIILVLKIVYGLNFHLQEEYLSRNDIKMIYLIQSGYIIIQTQIINKKKKVIKMGWKMGFSITITTIVECLKSRFIIIIF